jgi:ABC-type Fe3+ transport system substrate-binding protein
LEKVNWSGIFPWVSKEMEIFPGEGVLVYTSPNGIVYNSNLVPKDKAPRRYEDLVDPDLVRTSGKLAIPVSIAWLVKRSGLSAVNFPSWQT